MRKKTNRRTGFRRIFGLLVLLMLTAVVSCTACSGTTIDSRIATAKDTAAQVVDSIRSGDLDKTSAAFAELDALVNEYHSMLTASPLAAAKWMPGYGADVKTVIQYMELWQEAYPKLLVPALDRAQEVGLPSAESLSADPTALSRQMREYADLYETLYPEMLTVADRLSAIPDFRTAAIADRVGPYQALLRELCRLLPELGDLPGALIRPAADLLESYPLTSLRAQDGINVEPVLRYCDFYKQIRPYTLGLIDTLNQTDLNGIGTETHGKLMEAVETVRSILERTDAYVTVAQKIFGDGQDQLFLVVAQNPAELRAGGGFPGVVCAATVKDGCASLGSFSSSWELLPGGYVQSVAPDSNECTLFGGMFLANMKDATFNPHFPMVARAWAVGHGERFRTTVNGIVSVTPHIIQELLDICGPITLSNGAELTGENCMQYLQHDIYYEYLAWNTADLRTVVGDLASGELVDALFEETAKTVMEKMIEKLEGHLTLHDISMLLDLVENSFANRTVMLWMADDGLEQQIKELGWSGALNFDPQKPEIGVYYSVQDSNKVGYFVDIETSCDDASGVGYADGSVTWPVKVRLQSKLTEQDLIVGEGNWYRLLGSHNGNIASSVYFFAPAGGRIDAIEYSVPAAGLDRDETDFSGFTKGEYQDLQLYYNSYFWLYPGEVIDITFMITTAPGVSVKPGFSMTPLCSLKY